MKAIIFCLALLLACLPVTVYAQSVPSTGSFAFTLQGYTVQGQLSNAIINTDNGVTMTMSIEDSLQTSIGAIPVSGTGYWSGAANGTSLSGTIQNVSGSIQVCYFLFFCGSANYVGEGTWTGALSAGQGAGTFSGSITFTSSSISQIPLNQPIPISGNWNSNFQTSN